MLVIVRIFCKTTTLLKKLLWKEENKRYIIPARYYVEQI